MTKPVSTSTAEAKRTSSISRHSILRREDPELGPSSGKGHLLNCEGLVARETCDKLYFSQLLPLIKRDKKTCNYENVSHPVMELERICQLVSGPTKLARDLSALNFYISRDLISKGVSIFDVVSALEKEQIKPAETDTKATIDGAQVPTTPAFNGYKKVKSKKVVKTALRRMALRQKIVQRPDFSPYKPRPPLHPTGSASVDLGKFVRDLISRVMITQSPAVRPSVGFEIIYGQDWCSTGFSRGNYVRSIPLTAGAQKEIRIKSWEIRKDLRKELESVDKDISSEISGDEKWSLKTAKKLAGELNSKIGMGLTGGLEVPIKGVTAKVEKKANAEVSGTIKTSIAETQERVNQATIKSTNDLKQKHSSSVETSEEFGTESIVTETISNPNKCKSLTYHFFEISEQFQVTTQVESISPVLFVPMAFPVITPEWLLCNECLLRKHLPCSSLYAGFDAARLILASKKLGDFLGNVDTDEINEIADASLEVMERVLAAYFKLSNAQLALIPEPGSDFGQAFEDIANSLEQFGDDVGGFFEDLGEKAGEAIDDFTQASSDVIENIDQSVTTLVSGFFNQSQAQTANSNLISFSVVEQPGGPGSYLYWEIVKIVAPELIAALAALRSSYDVISAMEPGPARTTATIVALNDFFRAMGNLDEVLGKIDIALKFVAGIIAAASFGGIVAAATFVAATLALASPIIFVLGTAAIGALHILIIPFLAGKIEDAGFDIVPDDEGLKAAIAGLTGLHQTLRNSIDLPTPPVTDDPAITAAYQLELQETKQRRRELAVAQVELDNLICHIKADIFHYSEIYWRSVGSEGIKNILQETFHIPPHVLEPGIVGFSDGRAAFRVSDLDWLKMSGINFENALEDLRDEGVVEGDGKVAEITLPTRGVTVEPELGRCDACDETSQTQITVDDSGGT